MNSNQKLFRVINDFVFKALFGREDKNCKIILMDFLNTLLNLKGKDDEIKEISYLNPFNLKEYKEDKLSILDIKVKTVSGERINIEVQVRDTDNFRKRSLYYWAKVYSETISESEQYSTLKKCIVINIIDYNLLTETNKYHSVIKLLEKDEKFEFLDDFEMHFIELEKFDDTKKIEDMSELEKWITFIKDTGQEGKEDVINKMYEGSGKIKMAIEMLGRISSDEIMRQKYLDREQARIDRKSAIYYAEQKGIEKGMKEGIEKGMKEGIEKGIEKGMKEGIEKGRMLMAKNLLLKNIDINVITDVTGISIEQLEKIKEQL